MNDVTASKHKKMTRTHLLDLVFVKPEICLSSQSLTNGTHKTITSFCSIDQFVEITAA